MNKIEIIKQIIAFEADKEFPFTKRSVKGWVWDRDMLRGMDLDMLISLLSSLSQMNE